MDRSRLPSVVRLDLVRRAVLPKIYDAAFRTVHHQLLFRKIKVNIHFLSLVIEKTESHNFRLSSYDIQRKLISSFIISQ